MLAGVETHRDWLWGLAYRMTGVAADADEIDNPLVGGGDPATPGNVISLDDRWSTVVGSLRASHPVTGCSPVPCRRAIKAGTHSPNDNR